MWEELQIPMDKLFAARYYERKLQQGRRRYDHQVAWTAWK
ncbi:hypothetical protein NC653_024809 [Populus alba x Populus x berolinensis]|uniref:Uncharacterized protein n=1 Tax=Populus alba x Populus x berolinensis TaxID=444605 RepID=A0AAD6MAA4_9ROSI|nr:hypothetical protein NC653_024809 [Populus alba x Populus x berolinensis]